MKGEWRNDAVDAWYDAIELSDDAIVQEVEMGSPVRIKVLTSPFESATL